MRNLIIYLTVKTFLIVSLAAAHELSFDHSHGEWSFKKVSANTCAIFQIPVKENGNYTSRGPVIFYVFNEGNAQYIRIDTGYPYDTEKYVKVTIDDSNYQFFGEDDSAWSMKDDKVVIEAMKAGKNMTVVGYSQRGTETTDTYSLIGFTNAYNSMTNDC